MNLYLIGLNIKINPNLLNENFLKMKDVYPLLDEKTFKGFQNDLGFLYIMHNSESSIKPREYYFSDDNNSITYSGLPVHMDGKYPLHKSRQLSQHWEDLINVIDGQCAVFNFDNHNRKFEFINDMMGVEQIYYLQKNDKYLFSNSIKLIESIFEFQNYDKIGINLFLDFGYFNNQRTYNRDVKVVEGGSHWTYNFDKNNLLKERYFDPLKESLNKKNRINKKDVISVCNKVGDTLKHISQEFPKLTVPLTSGKDSRSIAGFFRVNEINADYYTCGSQTHKDVAIASDLSKRFNLDHSIRNLDEDLIIDNWDSMVKDFIFKNDAMVDLVQLRDYVGINDNRNLMELRFPGHGAFVLKSSMRGPQDLFKKPTVESIFEATKKMDTCSFNSLLNKEVIKQAENFMKDSIQEYLDLKIDSVNIYDLFHKLIRGTSWQGITQRKMRPIGDDYFVLYNRHLLKYIFTIKDSELVNSRLFRIFHNLFFPEIKNDKYFKNIHGLENPQLYNLSRYIKFYAKMNMTKNTFLNSVINKRYQQKVLKSSKSKFNNNLLLDKLIHEILCLLKDNPNSELWDYLNKKYFDYILSDNTDRSIKCANLSYLYRIANLFYLESFRKNEMELVKI